MLTDSQLAELYEDLKMGCIDQVAIRVAYEGQRHDAARLASQLAMEKGIELAVEFCDALQCFENDRIYAVKSVIGDSLRKIAAQSKPMPPL